MLNITNPLDPTSQIFHEQTEAPIAMDANNTDNDDGVLKQFPDETSTQIAASWNTAQETLLASIADRSNCLRWLHSKCQTRFEWFNFCLSLPSIAVSTLVGSLTMSLPSLSAGPQTISNATTALGLLGIAVGVLTSINQYMKSAQLAEAHRAAAVAYGKLHRKIQAELAIRRDQRSDAIEFLKVVRSEQDRLQETSPNIVNSVIQEFNEEFSDKTELEKPEIVGDLEHVLINRSIKPGSEPNKLSTPQLNETPQAQKCFSPRMPTRVSLQGSLSTIHSREQDMISPKVADSFGGSLNGNNGVTVDNGITVKH